MRADSDQPYVSSGRSDEERELARLERSRAQSPPAPRRRRGGWIAIVIGIGLLIVLLVATVLVLRSGHGAGTSKPAPKAIVLKVVIPEGQTRREIAATAKVDHLRGSYLVASKHSTLLSPASYGAPASTPNLEGFLFPASYEVFAGAPASRLVEEQLSAFTERFGEAQVHRAHALGITPYQLLIVASMIEGEAELARDRSRVAAVIYNRLRLGMPLGIDATIRYALNDHSKPLTEAQLHSNSPYNTRVHRGLPPTPIGNPGVAAIEAAAHPARVPYLYYVAGADGCGELVFSQSYTTFLHNAAAYNEAVANNGGRVPTCRK